MAHYSLHTSVGPLFGALSDLEKGDALKLYNVATNFTETLTLSCQNWNPLTVADASASLEGSISIQCAPMTPEPHEMPSMRRMANRGDRELTAQHVD